MKEYFEESFRKSNRPRPRLTGIEFKKISEEDSLGLEKKFSKEEIREVVFRCEGDRSPGPGGFNIGFIKICWGILGNDITHYVQDFHLKVVLPRAFTASFLALIQKVEQPQGLADYRPICLIGCIYEIISKLIVAR